jgi:Na+/melibiose symporter-like transporter
MVYTVSDVPYWGLSTAMTSDTYRRGNLLTVARLLCTAGSGLVTIIIPQLTSQMTSDKAAAVKNLQAQINAGVQGLDGALEAARGAVADELKWIYFIAAIVIVAVGIPLFFVGFKHTKERTPAIVNPPSLSHNLKLLFKNKPLGLIVLSGVLGAGKMVFTYTGGLYFCKYVLAETTFMGAYGEGLYTFMTMAIVPGGLIASLLVPYLTKKFGKKNSYIWSHLVGGVALLIAWAVGFAIDAGNYANPATIAIMFVAIIIAGVPSGLSNIVSYAMIGDTVEYLEMKTGERAEGICFAMQTFLNKISMAIGAFVGVLAYYLAGVESNNPGAMANSDKDVMWHMLMLLAAISTIAAAIPLFFYKFNEKEQKEAVEFIEQRKASLLAAQNADGGGSIEFTTDGNAVSETANGDISGSDAE